MGAFFISCGGTGGHVFPGLATADTLRERGHDVTVCFAGKAIEQAARRSWDGPSVILAAENYGASPAGLLKTLRALSSAYRRALVELRERRTDAVLAMGSYSSIAPVLAARRLRIPVVIHEANVIPGRAVEFLSRFSEAVALTFPETLKRLRHGRKVVTGVPLRKALEQAAAASHPEPDTFTVLVMGGSQGAQRLNEQVPQALAQLYSSGVALQVIHLSGERDKSRVETQYSAAGVPCSVAAFQQDMAAVYSKASLAIARSGASSCAELMLFRVPSVLVPYPQAARNHQAANAAALADAGGALVIEQTHLSADGLASALRTLHDDRTRLADMRERLQRLDIAGAAGRLADLIERTGAKR